MKLALEKPELPPRELAVAYTDQRVRRVSESTVYRLLKTHGLITSPAYILMHAADKFSHPTARVNEMWQTDVIKFKVMGWGWYYLSTILDDYSRLIVAGRLCTTMSTKDVSDTLDDALRLTNLDQLKVKHKPRVLNDNGPSYISGELAQYLKANDMTHTRGKPYHPQTQGKIERWYCSFKNRILLENYCLPEEFENQTQQFIHYYHHERYHESLNNLTSVVVCYGRGNEILKQRQQTKVNTFLMRKQMHYQKRAQTLNPMSQTTP